MSRRKGVVEANKAMTTHFVDNLKDIEQRVAKSNQQLWQNQQMMNNGLRAAEEHIALIRRVLNDALGGTTKVVRISRPSQDPDAPPGTMEEAQIIDWDWYIEQFRAAKGIAHFVSGVDDSLRRQEAKERTIKVQKLMAGIETEALRAACADEEAMKELVEEVVEGVPWSKQLYHTLRQMGSAELQKRKPAEPPEAPTPPKRVKKGDDPEDIAAAQQELLDEFKDIAELSGEAVKAIEAGDEVGAQEAMAKLEAEAEKQIRQNPETVQDFPDGAQIFGGK